jgi:hypothetical protein
MTVIIVYIIIIIGMNVVDNLNSVYVINKPCVCSSTMRLSTFCSLHRDTEHWVLYKQYMHSIHTLMRDVPSRLSSRLSFFYRSTKWVDLLSMCNICSEHKKIAGGLGRLS